MSKIKLTTVTPVHIGNGNVLRNNIDFIQENIDGDNYIGIIDPNRLWKYLGTDHLDAWITAIEREECISEFVNRFSPKKLSIENYSSRLVYCPQPLRLKERGEMREFIHDGLGKPYIPGSSIKGAIRTAILAHLVQSQNINIDDKINTETRQTRNGKTVYSAKSNIEKELFGKDPNSDCFRFLQVGDAFFENACEDALNMSNINIRENSSFADFSKQQVVEVVTSGEESHVFNMKIANDSNFMQLVDQYNKFVSDWNGNPNNSKKKNLLKKFSINNLSDLFKILKEHTRQLLSQEISFWEDYKDKDGVEEYISSLKEILDNTKKCSENECIIRVGHASGWRFITGAWVEAMNSDDKWDAFVNAARPNNYKYSELPFPKSRRVNNDKEDGIQLLGFVKLTIVE